MSDKQPEALRLADALERGEVYESHSAPVYGWCCQYDPTSDAAAELRRLHALNVELVEALQLAVDACIFPSRSISDAYEKCQEALSKAKES